jgi:hypothetical protein
MKGLHRQVLMLAVETGWSRADILALPVAEFQFYLRDLAHVADEEED